MRRSLLASLVLLIVAFTATAAGNLTYILSRDGNAIISGGTLDIDRVVKMNGRFKDDSPYLWARIGGKQYLIRDAATLNEAYAAFRHVDALHAEYERLHAKMEPVEEKERELEHQVDRLGDDLSDRDDLTRSERAQMEERLEALTKQLKPVQKQLRALEEVEEDIDQREEALTDEAERELRRIIDRAIASGVAQPL